MRSLFTSSTWLWLLIGGLLGCSCSEQEKRLFEQLPSSQTGIDFQNTITDSEDFNILNFHYIYNGGGVGLGDFNQDGLPDLVFTGNQVPSKLYLNQGNLKFQDITQSANFKPEGWATGVSIVDINGDGRQDIYISVGGLDCSENCKNQLFIHQGLKNGVPTFEEQAEQYGLSDAGNYTQQTAFFDFDLDGDLDAYLVHNVIDRRDKNAPSPKRFISPLSKDKLLRNDNGKFVDISETMGVFHRGYGLGVTINDFNSDGLPDVYVANDFLSNDLLYLNRGLENDEHLGFEEASAKYLKHQTYNSMGVDVADVNNDALPDIVVLDMMPEYHERQKRMQGFMNYNKFLLSLREGYAPQFVRNTLQLHNGSLADSLLAFSEIGYMAGIYCTDWSWTPLLADFDNDGDRDLYVTNGYGKDITDLDFINYSNEANAFGSAEDVQANLYAAVQKMETVTMPNFIFENTGNLEFEKRSKDWINTPNSISNGAVYSDLDNDGDLDIVVNNIDQAAFVLQNNSTQNYLKIRLEGTSKNPSAIGTKVSIWHQGKQQTHFQSPVRGYLSSVDEVIHFGLGNATEVDSLEVIWPDGKISFLQEIMANQTLEISTESQLPKKQNHQIAKSYLFKSESNLEHQHTENEYYDFDAQPLLLHQHSRQGPCIISANVDGKAGEELFIGGAKGKASSLFYQDETGKYQQKSFPDATQEVTDAYFFDADRDGDLDLYVAYGGTAFTTNTAALQDKLYWNDGSANFMLTENTLPEFLTSSACVAPCDFDKDGYIDLFVGGRVVPRAYPNSPESHLLLNEAGRFQMQTPDFMEKIGMISDAVWQDIDADGWQDLIVVGEWMPITIFKNEQGKLQAPQSIPNSTGLWNCLEAGDFDKDGDVDFMLGNLGKNSRLRASKGQPLVLNTNDLDNNGSPDPFIGQYTLNKAGQTKLYPLHARDDVMKQMPNLKNQYLKYADFAKASFQDLFKAEKTYQVNHLASSYLENKGNGNFELHELPIAAQIAPIQAILIDDFDKDTNLDALLVGNDYTAEKNNGWYDAANGLLLHGDRKGNFAAIPSSESGFYVAGDARSICKHENTDRQVQIIVGQNAGQTLQFSLSNASLTN